ncbi:MAG: prepilin-type N-terminal cleavage/methylation domain-containing protein [Kiritimatiellae bacterium]|nr:prepilin-type N-terminal cleavage/methylation domain-containing protein [Kiritimatiellia bacterium]
MKRAFTLIELLVVMAMIAIIAAAMTTGVANAQRRARTARASTEAREITNAILAFRNFDEDGSLDAYTMEEQEATESNLGFILGKVKTRNSDVPVLYNASITGGKILDPWGNPYRVTVRKGETITPPGVGSAKIRMFYPNWHRLTGGER